MQNLLDTSILMGGKAKRGIVTYPVLQELDGLKTSEGLKGKQAGDALHDIYKNPRKYSLVYEPKQSKETVDDFLIRFSLENNLLLCTLDLSLYLKASTFGCDILLDYTQKEEYTGITYLSELDFAKLITGYYHEKHPVNHFLIYGKQAYITTQNGFEKIGYYSLDTINNEKIKARNIEQYCLFELLHRKVPVILNTGPYGSGY